MKIWNLYPSISAPMPFQMAFDELLFRRIQKDGESSGPFLRFYFSSEPWITLGYSQENNGHKANSIPVCKRITGGGTVFHGKDLVFSITALKSHDESFGSVRILPLR